MCDICDLVFMFTSTYALLIYLQIYFLCKLDIYIALILRTFSWSPYFIIEAEP